MLGCVCGVRILIDLLKHFDVSMHFCINRNRNSSGVQGSYRRARVERSLFPHGKIVKLLFKLSALASSFFKESSCRLLNSNAVALIDGRRVLVDGEDEGANA